MNTTKEHMKSTLHFQTYQSPFSWRYGSEQMRRVFSEQHKYELWRSLWVALAQAEHQAGIVTKEELKDLQDHQRDIDIGRILELEKETKHDVVAAIHEFAEKATVGGGKIHLGATSMDIVDNADMMRIQEGLTFIEQQLKRVLERFVVHMEKTADVVCMGYTHLQPAEPTTIGYRLASYAQDLLKDIAYIQWVQKAIKSKGMKGAVGTRSSYTDVLKDTSMTAEELDLNVMNSVGLRSDSITTQVYSRKHDYLFATGLASIASTIAKFASDLRMLQSPGCGEWSEPFGTLQVGSSAMPFKKNPVDSEKICSLARYVVSLPGVLLENATLSHLERTLDDSANRRIIISELFLAVDEILLTAEKIVQGLQFRMLRIKHNLDQYGPFAATESILIHLVKKGANRQEMHELLRTIAMESWEYVQRGEINPIQKLLKEHSVIRQYLSDKEIESLLDVSHHVGDAPERVKLLIQDCKKVR